MWWLWWQQTPRKQGVPCKPPSQLANLQTLGNSVWRVIQVRAQIQMCITKKCNPPTHTHLHGYQVEEGLQTALRYARVLS